MRFNPCGRLVDWRRVPFTSEVRAFRNSDESAGVVWYPVAKGAPALGMSSVIAVPDWDDITWHWSGSVGEYTADRNYSNQRPKVIAGYDHVCGSAEDFEQGGLYDESLPPVLYGQQGLPTCCAAPVVGVGGLGIGGVGSVGFLDPAPTPGVSCSDAGLVTLGQTYNYLVQSGDPSTGWWAVDLPAAGNYAFRLLTLTGLVFTSEVIWRGTCPAGLILVGGGFKFPGTCTPVNKVAGGIERYWFNYSAPAVGGGYSFRIDSGPC